MASYTLHLEHWLPRLVAVWRQLQGRGKRGQLTAEEMRAVGAAIRRLSLGLTRQRHLVGERYLDDPRLLGAYLLFYWPISYAQARETLSELEEQPRRVLDLGSGPAPLAFAALDAGAREATAADRSTAALKVARALAAQAGRRLAIEHWNGVSGDGPQRDLDLITMGHTLNELFGSGPEATLRRADLCEKLATRLRPGGRLLLIEPALKETSRELLRVRDELVARGHAIRAPCLFRGSCPALLRTNDWCHAERPWEMPLLTQQLAREAGLHKEALKMSYLIVAPKGETWARLPPAQLFRVVSEPLAGKGRRRYLGCGPEGRVGLALQHKHESPANAAFMHLRRGEIVALSGTEARGDGLALTPNSTVKVVARPGEVFPGPSSSSMGSASSAESEVHE